MPDNLCDTCLRIGCHKRVQDPSGQRHISYCTNRIISVKESSPIADVLANAAVHWCIDNLGYFSSTQAESLRKRVRQAYDKFVEQGSLDS